MKGKKKNHRPTEPQNHNPRTTETAPSWTRSVSERRAEATKTNMASALEHFVNNVTSLSSQVTVCRSLSVALDATTLVVRAVGVVPVTSCEGDQ
ncbi:hypothetical protein E2C01_064291 [Portunus trituberculatus]|uniref:Uncharacterized protein n=1 Tax=Portunus trituberculatus TaxID=210409 RepID=A0A5B7HNC8_PORTR|nr:hypothetical protein [Portunus trituberculatus]